MTPEFGDKYENRTSVLYWNSNAHVGFFAERDLHLQPSMWKETSMEEDVSDAFK